MAVIINELEVVVEAGKPPSGEAPPEPQTETPSPAPFSTGDIAAINDFLRARAARVRAH